MMAVEPTSERWFSRSLGLTDTFIVVHDVVPEHCLTVQHFYDALRERGGSDQWLFSVIKRPEDIEISLSNVDFRTEDGFSKKLVVEVVRLTRDEKGRVTHGSRLLQTTVDSQLPRLELLSQLFLNAVRIVEEHNWT